MNEFELHLLYKNETGNTVPELSQTCDYDDQRDNLLEDIKEMEILIAQISKSSIEDLIDKIQELEERVSDFKITVNDLNTDIDLSLDENSRDYVEWLETKIK